MEKHHVETPPLIIFLGENQHFPIAFCRVWIRWQATSVHLTCDSERIFVPKAYRGNLNSWMMSCWIWDNAGWMPDGLPFTAVWRIIEGTRWCPRSFAKLALNWLNCWVYSDYKYSYGKTLWFARKIRTVFEHSPATCSNTCARPVFWYFPDET